MLESVFQTRKMTFYFMDFLLFVPCSWSNFSLTVIFKSDNEFEMYLLILTKKASLAFLAFVTCILFQYLLFANVLL